jgi:hypothetical protein
VTQTADALYLLEAQASSISDLSSGSSEGLTEQAVEQPRWTIFRARTRDSADQVAEIT